MCGRTCSKCGKPRDFNPATRPDPLAKRVRIALSPREIARIAWEKQAEEERKKYFAEHREKKVYYLLPLQWSLHYVTTEKEWQAFRSRVKEANPGWEKCPSCPNGCKANSCDEVWNYDWEYHVKRLVKAEFICPGCHWFKTLPWRMETWQKMKRGEMPPITKPPHIISCLGWTQEEVDKLRKQDMALQKKEAQDEDTRRREINTGIAETRYWTAELSALGQYSYLPEEIAEYERRMNARIQP